MQIISNESVVIEHLDTPQLVDKYQCRFRIKTQTGTIIYFTNVECKGDIELLNFVSVAKLTRSYTYVLAPDVNNTDRKSYLIIFGYNHDRTPAIGYKQRVLFDFFDSTISWKLKSRSYGYGQIVALCRDFPELLDSNDYLLTISMKHDDKIDDVVFTNTGKINTQYGEEYTSRLRDFVMFGRYDSIKFNTISQVLHPATRFVIDDDNIILVPEGTALQTIQSYLNLDEIPNGVAIHQLPEGNISRIAYIESLIRKLEREKRHKVKFMILGFDYSFTYYIRDRIHRFYL